MDVREHCPLTDLNDNDKRYLKEFSRTLKDEAADQRKLEFREDRNGQLVAPSYVGTIETCQGTVINILPKIDLTDDIEETKDVFNSMVPYWGGFPPAEFDDASIRTINDVDMLVSQFLTWVIQLTRRGLARTYRTHEDNLSCLRGRILFPQHIRKNLVDRSRFFVGYDEFTANRPENRLICLALRKLVNIVRDPTDRQRLHQLRIAFSGVPDSTNLDDDWVQVRLDRSIRHYDRVMQWVRVFLSGKGFVSFGGNHVSRSVLFPTDKVFEHFVTCAVRHYQEDFEVSAQEQLPLARDNAGDPIFFMKPDIVLRDPEDQKVRFILDTKWKDDASIDIHDVYQLFAYGKGNNCERVVLVYPKSSRSPGTRDFEFRGRPHLDLVCFPFNVADPKEAISELMRKLNPRP